MCGDEKIDLMICRALQLRYKIADAIPVGGDGGSMDSDEQGSLFGVREALESLERQLVSLQALHHRQRSERQAVLSQIDHSCKTMLVKLKEYNGEALEVIHEAATFASDPFMAKYSFLSPHCDSKISAPEKRRDIVLSELGMPALSARQNKQKSLRFVLGFIAKSAIIFAGIACVLSLTGFKPEKSRKRDAKAIDRLGLSTRIEGEGREASYQCPFGKALVMEDGKPCCCFVKERVEIPFSSDFENLNLSIGFG